MSCPGCQHKQPLSEEEIERQVMEQLLVEVDQVPDSIRQSRLEICQNCAMRIKQTCKSCGCFIKFRASLLYKQCPLKKW